MLHEQGIIKEAIVSFNYEDPEDATSASQVVFGEIVFTEILGGKPCTNYYSNLGRDKWGLLIDDFLYDERDMTNSQGPKIALIDSGNVSIQLPQYVWENVLISMQHESMNDNYRVSVADAPSGLKEIRIENYNCKDILHKLKPIYFKLESTEIKIYPKGYTYQIDPNQGYCQVGLQGIPGESNEYRLGTIFLRNFYTSFDYDKDQIAIGINRGSSKERAEIIGHSYDPFDGLPDGGPTIGTYILVILMAIMCAGITIFIVTMVISRKRKQYMEQVQNQ